MWNNPLSILYAGVFTPQIDGVYLLTVYGIPLQTQEGEMYIKTMTLCCVMHI